jgi:hypothetical protein
MDEVIIPLKSAQRTRAHRRRMIVELYQRFQDVVPAAMLFASGVSLLRQDPGAIARMIAVAEIVSAAVLVALVGREIRKTPAEWRHPHGTPAHGHQESSIGWVEIATSVMLAVEVWAHWHETGHIRRPTVLMSVTTFVLGCLRGRLDRRKARAHALGMSDKGIWIKAGRRNPFRAFHADWEDIAAIEVSSSAARIVRKSGGSREIDLKTLENGDEVREAIAAAAVRLRTRAEQT